MKKTCCILRQVFFVTDEAPEMTEQAKIHISPVGSAMMAA